ncbi:MAG: restriction endonuclease subunit S [Oscillospiraceae bacterium]|nr:restriction endonuclease subunit S [Oscillospiraceae bacterium]
MKAADLRKAILQAAVQGRLVPQDKNDEPASELLKRIQAEKAALVKNGKLKKEKPLPPITEDEVPYDLPNGWTWCHLSDLGNIQSSKRVFTSEFVSKGIPFYRGTEIGALAGKRDVVSKYYITDKHYQDLINQTGKPIIGDLLMPSICPDGRIWLVDTDEPFYFKDGRVLWVRLLTENIDNKYIQQALKARLIADYSNIASGTTFAELKIFILKQIAIPLPPLFEQERIVRKIDELMVLCDELEVAEKELDTLESHFFNYLPKSILQAAVQGKLVPQDKNDEPASELLKRIQAEKAVLIKEGKLKKEKPLPPITEDEIPYDLPEGWVWCRALDVCSYIQRGKSPTYSETKTYPVVSQKCVQWKGMNMSKARFIAPETVSKYEESRKLTTGDLLWNSTGQGTLGRIAIYDERLNPYKYAVADSHVTVLRPLQVLSKYMYYWFAGPEVQSTIEERATGSTKQIELATSTIMSYIFPLPPLEEQQRIVTKVDELMALCDELKRVADQPINHDNVIPFPAEPKENIEPIAMAARGKVEGMSDQAKQAIEDLFGEDE